MSDLIERQAAIDAANSIINRDTSGNNDVVKAMTAWKEHIKGLPSAQPEIKCIAKVTLTDEQVKEAFEKAKCEILAAQPELIAQGAYVRGFEQGRTQGMLDAKLQQTCNKFATDCKWKKNIMLEIDKTIEEIKHNGKYHAKFVRENGELVIFGLEIAKHIIEKVEEDGQTD